MGSFSKHLRYREAGEQANAVNVLKHGEPALSLFTSTRILSLNHHIDITDASEKVVYRSISKVISLHDKTDIEDADGNKVAHIERKFLSFHERHYVEMADGKKFELSNELLHIYKDVTNIIGLGWNLNGNVWGLNFEILDENNKIIAVISQKMLSIHDKYCIDIYEPEFTPIVVAILVTLQHMIKDREAANSSN
ncbi:MAG: LURP-one-related family protein [Clostridia bacterium]|nr:LURP-one-related family protein [Clostridia bacterium]